MKIFEGGRNNIMKACKIFFLILVLAFLHISCASTKTEKDNSNISNDDGDKTIYHSEEILTGMPSNINGVVYGDINGDGELEPIPKAEITLDSEKFVVTLADGAYLLPNVINGEHTLFIHSAFYGFKDKSLNVTYDYSKERFMKVDIILEK